jgi:hypothetical protein
VELLKWCRLQWDRVLGAIAMVLGVLLLILGWIDVSGTEFVAKQIPYVVSAGLGGVVAVMLGGTLWLSADLRDEWRALDHVEDRLQEGDELVEQLEARITALEAMMSNGSSSADPAEANGHGRRRRSRPVAP